MIGSWPLHTAAVAQSGSQSSGSGAKPQYNTSTKDRQWQCEFGAEEVQYHPNITTIYIFLMSCCSKGYPL